MINGVKMLAHFPKKDFMLCNLFRLNYTVDIYIFKDQNADLIML